MANSFKQTVATSLALAGTPLVLFVSSSNALYLRNQDDLQHTISVLRPFLGLFVAALGVGAVLFAAATRGRLRALWWIYLVIGPAFMLFATFHRKTAALEHPTVVALLIGLTCAIGVLLARRFEPRQAVRPAAIVSAFLVAGELFLFVTRYEPQAALGPSSATAGETRAAVPRPNIYHVILDEFQTDMFLAALTPATERTLAGFVFFPNNSTVYGRTGMALPSIFSGRSYDYESTQIEYQQAAFNSNRSMLQALKQAGYRRDAYIHKVFTFPLALFDSTTYHKDNGQQPAPRDYAQVFRNLWFYANTPEFVARRVVQQEQLEQIQSQNLLPSAAPIMSRESFARVLQLDQRAAARGRYTFVHLVLPHFPNVLRSDCSYSNSEEAKTSAIEQTRCATQLIVDLVATLKRLGRFEESLLIIHGDHGSRYRAAGSELVSVESKGHYSIEWSWARSRALLLVKPAGRGDQTPFLVSAAETQLTDIYPTVLRTIGAPLPARLEGVPLVDPVPAELRRPTRYYHFYDKKGKNEWTDTLARFIIAGGAITFDRNIRLERNPPNES